jgi:hypothetical protein
VKINSNLKAGARVAPALIIALYILFVVLDLYTTYMASPDLKKEGNIIIQYFKLNWNQIFISVAVITIILISSFIIATNFINNYFRVNIIKVNTLLTEIIFLNKKMLISFFILGIFYSHLFCSIFLTINNYLSYIYLFDVKSSLREISILYLTIETKYNPYFFYYAYSFFILLAFLFVWDKIKRIRNKYRLISL